MSAPRPHKPCARGQQQPPAYTAAAWVVVIIIRSWTLQLGTHTCCGDHLILWEQSHLGQPSDTNSLNRTRHRLHPNQGAGEKDMQMGGFSFAIARTAAGTDHSPSPAMSPEAATGTNASASSGRLRSQTSFTSEPMHMSTCSKTQDLTKHARFKLKGGALGERHTLLDIAHMCRRHAALLAEEERPACEASEAKHDEMASDDTAR